MGYSPNKRHRIKYNRFFKKDSTACCIEEIYFSLCTLKLKVKGWEKVFHISGNLKKNKGTPMSYKMDFNPKTLVRKKMVII